jgi:hypothetical protein
VTGRCTELVDDAIRCCVDAVVNVMDCCTESRNDTIGGSTAFLFNGVPQNCAKLFDVAIGLANCLGSAVTGRCVSRRGCNLFFGNIDMTGVGLGDGGMC